MFALNPERNQKVFLILPPYSSAPSIGNRHSYQEEGVTSRFLVFIPASPTPGNTYSCSAPCKPTTSPAVEEGCESFRKRIPVKVNCRQLLLKFPPCLKPSPPISVIERETVQSSLGFTLLMLILVWQPFRCFGD